MQVTLGEYEVDYGSYLTDLRDSNDIFEDTTALQQRLAEDGYLLIRDLHPRDRVEQARRTILEFLNAEDGAIDTDAADLMEAVIREGRKMPRIMGNRDITHHPDVRAVLEGEPVFKLFERLFAEPVRTFDYKWLRPVGHGAATGAHYDFVYMGQGSGRLHTAWVPLGDIPIEQGTLAICVGSHNSPEFEKLRQTYGQSDVDRDNHQGWFTKNPHEITDTFGGQWATTNFRMGDVILFGMHTMHMSTKNMTHKWRLSCDTRFQPAADPVDKRWVGENPKAHYGWGKNEPAKAIAEVRKEWGV